MTRNPSVDYAAAHRRYVFGKDSISLSDLAVEMGCSRAALAQKAAGGEGEMSWFDQRREFESRIGEKTLQALADEWAAIEAESRRARMAASDKVLAKFVEGVGDGTIKITAKDAVEWAKFQREEFDDVRDHGKHPDEIEGVAFEMTKDQAKDAYDQAMKMLTNGSSQ